MRNRPPFWLWLVPVLTAGLLAVVGPFAIALKLGTKRAWAWCLGSGAATVLAFSLVGTMPEASAWDDIGGVILLGNLVFSTVYTMSAAQQIQWGRAPAALPSGAMPTPASLDPNQQAIAHAREARRKRNEAMALAEGDPQLARDLRIGRPDLPRQYNDGGLVAINGVPLAVFVKWLGLTQAQGQQIVDARERLGKFLHPDDLTNYAGIDVDTYDRIRDRLIVL